MESAIISILVTDNIFDEGHMYKVEVCRVYIVQSY